MTRFAILFVFALAAFSQPTQVVASDGDDSSPNSNPPPKMAATITESDRDKLVDRIVGEVKTPDGKPAAGAHVVIIGTPWRGDYSEYPIEVIAETTCDKSGVFRLAHFKPTSARWQMAQLFAVADGAGIVWRDIDLYEPPAKPLRITLPKGHEMRGRVTTADGKPAAAVPVKLSVVGHARDPDDLVFGRCELSKETFPVAFRTDSQGEFAVKNLPAGVRVLFHVDHEPFAYARWRWDVDDPSPHTTTVTEGRVVSGTVIAADTGQPLPGAVVKVPYVPGMTDLKGRFQLNQPVPDRFELQVSAPFGTPYLGKRFSVNHPQPGPIDDLKLELPRGVLVRGQVVEQLSGRPVPHANVNYLPRDTNPERQKYIFPGGNGRVTIADDNGSFVMGVPTGEGTLIVTAAGIDDVCRPVSRSLLTSGKIGELDPLDSMHLFAQMPLDIPQGAIEIPAQLEVERGATVHATIVGVDGSKPELVKSISFNDCWTLYSDIDRQRVSQTVFDGKLEIRGLAPDEERLVYLVDPIGKQGKLLHVKATDAKAPMKVALEPCGSVMLQFVDGENHPVPGYTPELPPIQLMFLPEEIVQGNVSDQILANANELVLDLFDYRNAHDFTTDRDGRMTFSALIPGAIYQVSFGGVFRYIKVGSGQQLEMPAITITDQKVIAKAAETWKAKSTDRTVNNSAK
jgi:hypothetical protein